MSGNRPVTLPEAKVAGAAIRPTLPALIGAAAKAFGDREYIVLGGRRLNFRDVERESAQLARGLLGLGVGKGARVGLLMANTPDWAVNWFACARAGALTVALSTFFQARELSWGLRHNDVDTLLIQARYLNNDYLAMLERAIPELADQRTPDLLLPSHPYLRRIVVWGECDRLWALRGPDDVLVKSRGDDAFLAEIEANIAPSDSLITICTSGSTAEPKAVVHGHGAVVRATAQFLPYYDFQLGDRHYSGHPFFWIGGLNVNLLPALMTGGCQVCAPSPRAEDVAETVAREKITRLAMWPAQIADVREAAARGRHDLSSVRIGLVDGAGADGKPIPRARRYGGVFGMTETFGMHSLEKLDAPVAPEKAGSHGRPLPGVERRIVDPATGKALPPGEVGELHLRGYTLMQGYYKREREECFTRDGFFPTGDLCSVDEDNYLRFHGRLHEMIKTTGANVSPREVELALLRCAGVREAFVFGVPDARMGEGVHAVLVPSGEVTLDVEALLRRLRSEISPYKIPKLVHVMAFEDIPRTHSDKVDKPRLKQILAGKT